MGQGHETAPAIDVRLRKVVRNDLPVFFEHQLDPVANQMAAFTAVDPRDRERFDKHWERILGDATIVSRTILAGGEVVGHVLSFMQDGNREVSYWLGRNHWGQGIATRALRLLLTELAARPLYARAAKDNPGSIRVLQKCGFTICGEDKGFANARGMEIEEFVLVLAE